MNISIGTFTISVPKGWMAEYTVSPTFFVLYSPTEKNDSFQENCNLMIETLPSPVPLADYITASFDSIKEIYESAKLIQRKDNYMIISGTINGTNVKQLFYFFMNNKEAYVLTCSATPNSYARYEPVFKKIASSFSYK